MHRSRRGGGRSEREGRGRGHNTRGLRATGKTRATAYSYSISLSDPNITLSPPSASARAIDAWLADLSLRHRL